MPSGLKFIISLHQTKLQSKPLVKSAFKPAPNSLLWTLSCVQEFEYKSWLACQKNHH